MRRRREDLSRPRVRRFLARRQRETYLIVRCRLHRWPEHAEEPLRRLGLALPHYSPLFEWQCWFPTVDESEIHNLRPLAALAAIVMPWADRGEHLRALIDAEFGAHIHNRRRHPILTVHQLGTLPEILCPDLTRPDQRQR